MSTTPLLDQVHYPSDLKKLTVDQLPQLAKELRQELIDAVSITGGHLGAGLGVVELTIAIHYLFDTPNDRLIWDVGHQSYPHKILTGRRNKIRTLRQGGGLSGTFGGQAASSILGGQGAGNVLSKITSWLAAIFIGLAILISILSGPNEDSSSSVVKKASEENPIPIQQPSSEIKDNQPVLDLE